MKAHRLHQRGFTLIEMSVAIALVVMVAVSAFEGLRFAQRSYERVTLRGAADWDVFAAQRFLRGVVESAYPLEPSVSGASERGIDGDAQSIAILAPAPLALSAGGLYRYRVRLASNGNDRRDLTVCWEADLNVASEGMASSSNCEVLVPDVESVEWQYREAGDAKWNARWQKFTLPATVQLRVTFARGNHRRWPVLVMSTRISDDANCAFDVVSQRCRSST